MRGFFEGAAGLRSFSFGESEPVVYQSR